jgi:hypothetical protein
MDPTQTLLLLHIADGYSFGKMIGIVKNEAEKVGLIFSPKKIECSFTNKSVGALHKFVINTQEVTQYIYNTKDENGKLTPEYPITVDTNELFSTTKGLGRGDGIRIYWLDGDNKLNVQPVKSSTKDPGRASALFVKILSHGANNMHFNDDYQADPNVRVQAKDFADLCAQANSLKCSSLDIIGSNSDVVFQGMSPNNTPKCVSRFKSQVAVSTTGPSKEQLQELDSLLSNLKFEHGPTTPSNSNVTLNIVRPEDLMTVRVPISTVKALSKIHNISPKGTLLRFWFAPNKPIKIESPIGTYGVYIIRLRNVR